MTDRPNLLINLPVHFFGLEPLRPVFERLGTLANVRKTSHNDAGPFAPDLAWADAVIMWAWPRFTPELLAGAPRLRFAGHFDLWQGPARVALDRGLAVSVSRRAFAPAVAEMALGLVLSTLRHISDYHAAMRTGTEPWGRNLQGGAGPDERELTGLAVGLVGFGAVGQRLAELLAPFRVELRVVDPYVPDAVLEKHNARRVELREMMATSDVVVVCAAANPGTRRLIGRDEIAALPPGAVFVNVARAALVDTGALLERLRRGDVCAALDVFDKEPLEPDHPLRSLPNAYLTPHRAGGLHSSYVRLLSQLADDFEAHLQGRPRAHALTEQMIPMLDADPRAAT